MVGGVSGGVVALIIAALIILYTIKKRREHSFSLWTDPQQSNESVQLSRPRYKKHR